MYLLSRWDITPGIDRAIENIIKGIFTEFPIIKYLCVGIMVFVIISIMLVNILAMFEDLKDKLSSL